MKPAVLLISALVFFISFSVAGSETAKLAAECEANKDSAICQAYIAGLVEGYVISKQKYVAAKQDSESSWSSRAYATRVGNVRIDTSPFKAACLPKEVDVDEIISHIIANNVNENMTTELGRYLQKKYPCDK